VFKTRISIFFLYICRTQTDCNM